MTDPKIEPITDEEIPGIVASLEWMGFDFSRLTARIRADAERIKTLEAEVEDLHGADNAALNENAALRADQADWRKGVDLIASALNPRPKTLSCVEIHERVLALRAEVERYARLDRLWAEQRAEIDQVLGKALGYPRIATLNGMTVGPETEGAEIHDEVCTGEHVVESLVAEAAQAIAERDERIKALEADLVATARDCEVLRAENERLNQQLRLVQQVTGDYCNACGWAMKLSEGCLNCENERLKGEKR